MRRYEQHGLENLIQPSSTLPTLIMNDPPWCAVSAMESIGSLTRGTIISMAFVTGPEVAWIGTKTIRATRLKELPEVLQAVKQQPRFLADRFWPDGMVRVSDGSLRVWSNRSAMRKDPSCLSCHQMHHLQPEVLEAWRPGDDQLKPDGGLGGLSSMS